MSKVGCDLESYAVLSETAIGSAIERIVDLSGIILFGRIQAHIIRMATLGKQYVC
jgi:hypothetical protein